MSRLPWPAFFAGALAVLVVQAAINGMRPPSGDELEAAASEVRARVEAERAAEALALADSYADSLARVRLATADSAAEWASRTAEATLRAQHATAQASEARAAHVATLDSVQVAAFGAYEAARDSVDAAKDVQVTVLASDRDMLRVEVGLLDSEVVALRQALVASEARGAGFEAANASLRRALAGERRKSKVVTGVAVLIGGKLVYDLVTSGGES